MPAGLSTVVYACHMFIDGIEKDSLTRAPVSDRPCLVSRTDTRLGPLAELGADERTTE
jgi:hypothetical protein